MKNLIETNPVHDNNTKITKIGILVLGLFDIVFGLETKLMIQVEIIKAISGGQHGIRLLVDIVTTRDLIG